MKFPKEVQEAIKECILSVIWPKKDIISFLKKYGCTKFDLAPVKRYKDLTRPKIVYLVFRQLSSRNDGGETPFKRMNRALLNWKNFDTYYFDDLEKLQRKDAAKVISNLLEAQTYLEK